MTKENEELKKRMAGVEEMVANLIVDQQAMAKAFQERGDRHSAIAAAEKIYFFQLTRHLQINLFQLGLRFIFITLHLTTFINVTSQPHL